LADRLLTGLGQPRIHKLRYKEKWSIVLLRKEIVNKLLVIALKLKIKAHTRKETKKKKTTQAVQATPHINK
jgi:hypothetical protein